jgi:uncharacterized membrane protein YeaQ/YmgE (transglycosylase-associated protein family)
VCFVFVLLALAVVFAGGMALAGFVALATLIPWLVIGLIAGALASLVTNSRSGIIGDILLGIAGAFIGGALFAALHIRPFVFGRFVEATVGAIILLLVFKLIRGPTYS